jgi:hypothetical protein
LQEEAEGGVLETQTVRPDTLSRRSRSLTGSPSRADGDVLET